MKFSRDADTKFAEAGSRDEIRQIAEAVSLWRSAMHHVAAQQSEHPRFCPEPRVRRIRFGLLLVPALAAAVTAGVLVPVYSHERTRHEVSAHAVSTAAQTSMNERAGMDDTALMNQIDSELSQEVPDALRPLADLSEQANSNQAASEKKNATQE